MKPGGADAWMAFRDVFDVDGKPVRDRGERLAQLFLNRSMSTDRQIRKILDESARYNIGDIQRNVNTPVYPLLFLETANQFRFKFKQTKERTPATEPRTRRRTARSASRRRFGRSQYGERSPGR